MEFRLLGAFEVWDRGQPIEIAGAKRRALLALLVLRANEVVRSELLVDELWGDRPPRNASAALRNHVSRLRKALGAETIASREWGYVLRAAPEEIDLRRFESLAAEAEPLAAQQRATKLAEGLKLWRGPPLADLVNEPALQRDIDRLEELRLSTLERRIDADLELGRNANLVGELEALVTEHPLREHLRWLLILALYRAGRQAEALEVYRETRRVLTEELGLEPSPALKELEQAILRQDPSLDAIPSHPHAQQLLAEPERKRRRAPVALLALLALGLAGTATAIALVRPEKGTSSGTATEAIFQMLPTLPVNPTTDSHAATDQQRTTPKKHTTTQAAHSPPHAAATGSSSTTTSTHTTTTAHKSQGHHHTVAGSPTPVTITDDFLLDVADPQLWNVTTTGSDIDTNQGNGHLEMTIHADATPAAGWPNYSAYYTTTCSVAGRFDASIDFALQDWPTANGVSAGLGLVLANGGELFIVRESYSGGEYYAGVTGNPNLWHSLATTDSEGALRFKRVNRIITAYYRTRGRWEPFFGPVVQAGAVRLRIYLLTNGPEFAAATGTQFGHKNVTVDFSNFVLRTPPSGAPRSAALRSPQDLGQRQAGQR